MYNEFFKYFIERLKNQDSSINLKHYNKKSYIFIPYKGFKYSVVLVSDRAKTYDTNFSGIVVELYIDNKNHDKIFYKLHENKIEIEKELDIKITWQNSSETKSGNVCRIYTSKSVNIDDKIKWNEYIDWQIDMLLKFRKVFPKYTQNI